MLLLILVIGSCSEDDTTSTDLAGTWQLTEQLTDLGNGEGEYEEVESIKKITFDDDGNFTSNGSLCNMNVFANTATTGSYSTTQNLLYPDGCNFSPTISYALVDGELILTYTCIESCRQKYLKIN